MAVNARDAMGGEGLLTIAVRTVAELPGPAPQPKIPHGYVAVSVEDTGIGIPARQTRPHLRAVLHHQGGRPGHRARPVAGVRLRQAIRRRGDRRRARSARAARLRSICRASPATTGRSRQAPNAAPAVDGQRHVGSGGRGQYRGRQFRRRRLTELGYAITLVGNATDALAELTVDADRFDVVFSDVVMPGMTGIDLARKSARAASDLPVVLTSGYSHALAQERQLPVSSCCKSPIRSSNCRASCTRSAAGAGKRGPRSE